MYLGGFSHGLPEHYFCCRRGIATITINRPKALNALNQATVSELKDVVEKIAADKAIKSSSSPAQVLNPSSLALTSKKWLPRTLLKAANGASSVRTSSRKSKPPQPVIAAINGFALGGGCELACACDFRYAAENAKFGQPEVGLGITPGFGGTQRLPRVVGRGYGKEMIFRANMIDAQEAHRIGLVNKVVPQEELMDTCKKVAKEIMGNAPIAVQLAKTAINRGINCDVVTGIAYEDEVFALCFSTEDQKEGMDAFVNKRAKHFQGK